jgi:hypothetical protein
LIEAIPTIWLRALGCKVARLVTVASNEEDVTIGSRQAPPWIYITHSPWDTGNKFESGVVWTQLSGAGIQISRF